MNLKMFIIAIFIIAGTDTHFASVQLINDFTATYILNKKSDKVGTAIRKLEHLENGTAKYSYSTSAKWFIFSDKRSEISSLMINDSKVAPHHYLYERSGTGKDKKYEWMFDKKNELASDLGRNKSHEFEFPDNYQDKLSYHLQLRYDLIKNPVQKAFSYPVINTSGTLKNYDYVFDSEEMLKLPFGEIKTIKLVRDVADKGRTTYVWFAPELNYLLVKLVQYKDGKEQFDAVLKNHSTVKATTKTVQKSKEEDLTELSSQPKSD